MAKQREQLVETKPKAATPKESSNLYGMEDPRESAIERISSGCRVFDLALGGGWAKGRVINLVGDESSGKTLLAIEACANFAHRYGKGKPGGVRIRYSDPEEAFDVPYARTMGLPETDIDFGDGGEFETVQDFERCLTNFIKTTPKNVPGLYVLDSLDSLSEEDELDVKVGQDGKTKGTYGMGKAKAMSRLFRRLVRKLGKKDVTLLIISQTRDAIGVMFGPSKTRTGGKALNFYASQIVWLHQKGKIKKTKKGIERSVGVQIVARVSKNKAGDPFHTVEYPIYFRYGVDDVRAGLLFLSESKRMDALDLPELNAKAEAEGEDGQPVKRAFGKKKASNAKLTRFMDKLDAMGDEEYQAFRKRVNKAVTKVWREIEADFAPTRRKYA